MTAQGGSACVEQRSGETPILFGSKCRSPAVAGGFQFGEARGVDPWLRLGEKTSRLADRTRVWKASKILRKNTWVRPFPD